MERYRKYQKKLKEFEDDGILQKCGASEFAFPAFFVPKKTGDGRFVCDLRKLNAMLRRPVYPLPKIQDIISRRRGYKYFTKIDLMMQFYTFVLDEPSSWYCVVITPFGKYRYLRLPMGLCLSPDVAQEAMMNLLGDVQDLEVYMDDIGVFSNTFSEHLSTLGTVFERLRSMGFTISQHKCEWAIQESDWLGYWITSTGVRPWTKKTSVNDKLLPPTNIKE